LLKDDFNSGISHIWWVLVFAQYALDHQPQFGAKLTWITVVSVAKRPFPCDR
jgi:hypothetical protein